MNRPTPKVLVFDLDDTLFPEAEFVESGFRAVATWLSQEVGGNQEELFSLLTKIQKCGFQGRVFNKCLEELDLPISGPRLKQMIEVYRFHTPQIRLHKDVLDFLTAHVNSKTFGLITNGIAQSQRNKFEALGLGRFIDYTVFCGDLGPNGQKPSMVPYEHFMHLLPAETPPETIVYIGDHAQKDFIGAKKLGWQTIRIERPDGIHSRVIAPKTIDADHKITTFADLSERV